MFLLEVSCLKKKKKTVGSIQYCGACIELHSDSGVYIRDISEAMLNH